MLIIYANIFFTVLFFIFTFNRKQIENEAYFLLLISYFMLSLVFQEGSPDFNGYKQIYSGAYVRNVEPVFRYMNNFFYSILEIPFKMYWVLQGVFICLLLAKIIDYFSENKLLTTVLFMNMYFPLKTLIQMRNFISMVLFFCAGMYILRKKKISAGISYTLATGTHISGCLSIFAFNTKYQYNRFLFFIFVGSIFFLIVPFSKISSALLQSFTPSNTLVLYYIEWILNENFMGKTFFHITRIIGIAFLTWHKRADLDDKTRFLFNVFLIGGIVRFIFSSSGGLAGRLSETFLFSEVFLLPNVIKHYKHQTIMTLCTLIYSLLLLFLFVKNTPTFLTSYTWNVL